MAGDNEVLFLGKFKDFDFCVRFDLTGKAETDVAFALASINQGIEETAFRFSGIDCEKVRNLVTVNGGGLNAAVNFLSSTKPGGLRSSLLSACKNELLLSVAECYFFNQLFEKSRVPYKITPSMVSSSLKPTSEKPEDQIVLMGRFEKAKWIAIKKLSLDPKTEDWEVSGILSGINNTIVHKAFNFANASGTPFAVAGRKSLGNVVEALKKFVPSGNAINDAYALNMTMENLGYKPYANPGMLSAAHPGIKGVKLKGRKPKG